MMPNSFFDEIGIMESPKRGLKTASCSDCGLSQICISPKMQPTGKGRKKILFIAEAPGRYEDEKGIQLIGDSGQELREVLQEFDFDLDLDAWKTNAVICRPPKNRTPKTVEIDACRKYIYQAIAKYQPKVIILLGAVALDSLIGPRISGRIEKVSFSDWVGECIPDQELQLWICPVYHPAYILRNNNDIVLKREWRKQLQRAISMANREFYIHHYEYDIFTIQNEEEACELLSKLMAENHYALAYDYETTGLKPHREGHKILSVSISNGMFAWAFPFFESELFMQLWKKFVHMKHTFKIVHNESFERLWTQTICNTDIYGHVWDTAIAQHIIDNRKKTQLKFWVYINFGIIGYDDCVDSYMGAKKEENAKSANSFNRLDEFIQKYGIGALLKYNALDSLFTYKLYEKQNTIFNANKKLYDGYNLFLEGAKYLLKCSQNGIRINVNLLNKKREKIGKRMDSIKEKIICDPILEKWNERKKFDFKSNDLSHLLFNILKIDPPKYTKKGNKSIDHESLEKINIPIPIVKNILEYRRWDKTLNTYIAQYSREQINGILHPFFKLTTVTTYRSSSTNPNFQNVPKRDDGIKKILRSLIIPRNGNRLVSYDFKQMEVCVAACYNNDPSLISYVSDPTKDMHRDMAAELFLTRIQDVTKAERQTAKNSFVFPEFYGSYYEQVAPELWEKMPNETRNRLIEEEGFRDISDYTEHVKKVEANFWGKRFPVYAEWKKRTYEQYEKKGYIDFKTGFRCYGPMKRNEAINYRIQGTAFHILLWTLIQVMIRMEKRGVRSMVIGQIHDDIECDIYPDEEKYIDKLVWIYATQKVREHWDWINVPLRVEKERSEINGNWAEMSGCGFLDFDKKG